MGAFVAAVFPPGTQHSVVVDLLLPGLRKVASRNTTDVPGAVGGRRSDANVLLASLEDRPRPFGRLGMPLD